jgi:hypothetical protein
MDNMDKILTRKILGLKIGDILKCVILVVIGYCIAVMLGNCNCVEGWTCERTSPMPEECSAEMCGPGERTPAGSHAECNNCNGWIVDLNGGAGIPYIRDLRFECVNGGDDFQTKDACDKWRQDNVSEYIEEKAKAGKYQQGGSAPNCPRPPTPPTPPSPAATCSDLTCPSGTRLREGFADKEQGANPESTCCTAISEENCKYTGDSTRVDGELNKGWWRNAVIKENSCSTEIKNCRTDMLNWHTKYGGDYAGFCLQTLNNKDGKGRGACGRKKVDKEDGSGFVNISDPGTIGTDPLEAANLCRDPHTNNNGNFAWVAESATAGIDACNPHCPNGGEEESWVVNSTDTSAPTGCQYCEKLGPCNEKAKGTWKKTLCCDEDSSYWRNDMVEYGLDVELTCDEVGGMLDTVPVI